MATILAHITVRPDTEHQFEAVARELFAATHRDEREMLRYEYWRGSAPRSYYVHLSFTDFDAFIAHQVSPHHEAASPRLGELMESIRLEWIDPVVGASPLPPTDATSHAANSGDAGDELTVRYRRRFAASIADWWLGAR